MRRYRLDQNLIMNVLITLAIIGTGFFCLSLATYADYIAPLWMPAGIALGALIIWGPRAIGAVCIAPALTYFLVVLNQADPVTGRALLIAALIGLVSTFQTLLGRALMARFLGVSTTLSKQRDILILFFLGGLACAALGGGLVALILAHAKDLDTASALQLWGIWTVGNGVGVITLTPMVVLTFSPSKAVSSRRKVSAVSALVAILSIALLAFSLVAQWEEERRWLTFERQTELFEQRFSETLESHFEKLHAIERLYASSVTVDRQEFSRFVQKSFSRFPGFTYLAWAPQVRLDEIAAYQAKAADDGLSFDIFAFSGSNGKQERARKPVYYPIYFLESENGDRTAIGLDLASEPARRRALEEAAQTGEITLSPPLELFQPEQGSATHHTAVLAMHPVFTEENRADSTGLRGFIVAVLNPGALLAQAHNNAIGDTPHVALQDVSNSADPALLYDDRQTGHAQAGGRELEQRHLLQVGGRTWQLTVRRQEYDVLSDINQWQSWMVLIGGLVLCGLMGVLLLVITGRNDAVEELVAAKTRQLSADEEKLRMLIRHTPAAVAMFDLEMRYIMTSDRWIEDYGLRDRNIIGASHYDVFPEIRDMSKWLDIHQRALKGEEFSRQEDSFDRPGSGREWLRWEIHPWWDAGGKIGGIVMFTEVITARKRQQFRSDLMHRLALEAASADTIETGLAVTVDALCELLDCEIGHAYMLHQQTGTLFSANVWHLDAADVEHQEFKRVTETMDFSPGTGLPGLVLARKEPVYVDRTLDNPSFLRSAMLRHMGMNWGVAFPVFIAGEVEAVIELHSSRKIGTSADIRGLFEMVSLQLGRILERNRFRRALEESYRLNEAIVTHAPYMIIATDMDGQIILFNKAAEEALGYTAEAVIGKETLLAWHDKEEVSRRAAQLSRELGWAVPPNFYSFTAKALISGGDSAEWTLLSKDGLRFPVYQTIVPLRDSFNHITGFLCVVRDLTQQKAQEAALVESEQTFRLAMEHSSVGIALVRPNGKWLKVNPALCHLLGYERDELMDLDFQSVVHPEDLQIHIDYVRRMLKGQIQAYSMERRHVRKDGSSVWALLSISLVRDSSGRPNYFVAQVQDITERKMIETMKNEFVSTVSHELRTPLTSIRGALSLIASGATGQLPEKSARLIDIAHKNSERLILIINDILDIEKIESGRLEIHLSTVNAASFIEQALETNAAYGDKYDVSFKAEDIARGLYITADPDRLMQVMANLLSNAAKFSPKGAQVTVKAERQGEMVRFSVHDRGAGIPLEFQSKIFQKFAQADNSDTRQHEGTGLGLSITKRLVELMGGSISFTSRPGEGTTFFFDLPLAQAQSAGAPTDRSPSTDRYRDAVSQNPARPAGSRPRVLHVEDDSDLAGVIKESLGTEIDFIQAASLQDAKTKLAQETFDLMVLDLELPDGSGLELLETFHDENGNARPVIILSASDIGQDIRRKVSAVLVKSRASEETIIETILSHLRAVSVHSA